MKKTEITRRRTLFGLIAVAGAAPATGFADTFQLSRTPEIVCAPTRRLTLFGSRERVIGNPTELFPKPTEVGRPAACGAVAALAETIEKLRPFGIKGQIAGINAYVNNFRHSAKLATRFKARHWTAPIAYFGNNCGEDDALVKYVCLRWLGFHHQRLRVVWVEDEDTGSHHAVLTAALDGRTFVLDNHSTEIANDRMCPGYHPYCSANETRSSLHWNPAAPGGVMASLDRLARRPRTVAA